MLCRLLKPGDVLLLLLASLFTIGLFAHAWLQPSGNTLVVRAQGRVVARAPLDRNGHYDVVGKLGLSRIEVLRGRARVMADPGLRQICVKQGWLSRSGETALCLANEVSLEILGASKPYDSVNY
jgi:hypothetical protein